MNRTFEAFFPVLLQDCQQYRCEHLKVPFELMQQTNGNMSLTIECPTTFTGSDITISMSSTVWLVDLYMLPNECYTTVTESEIIIPVSSNLWLHTKCIIED